MSDEIAIKVDHVSKTFRLPHEKNNSIKGALINFRGQKKTFEKQRVLDDVSFEIKKGEFFGIVGRNGSGKSTLLKMLAGIYAPSNGSIQVNGKLTPFIELGVGFNPELTGRENVYLNGSLLGFSRKEMTAMYDDIVEFAELEKFMDQKLKNYSSGMQVRLAFSIAIRAQGDILVLDEVLAVGDALFQKKCYDYFKQLKKNKKTVVFVSHDSGALEEYCSEGILIESGRIVYSGNISKVVKEYTDILNKTEQKTNPQQTKKNRWGNGKATIIKTHLSKVQKSSRVYDEGETNVGIRLTFKANQDILSPVAGITISDLAGQIIFQSNTLWTKKNLRDLKAQETVEINWQIPNCFNTGKYSVSPAISDSAGIEVLDWYEDACIFEVQKQQKSHGLINVEHSLKVVYGNGNRS